LGSAEGEPYFVPLLVAQYGYRSRVHRLAITLSRSHAAHAVLRVLNLDLVRVTFHLENHAEGGPGSRDTGVHREGSATTFEAEDLLQTDSVHPRRTSRLPGPSGSTQMI